MTEASKSGRDHAGVSDQTRASVSGEPAPKLPHERDESMDTGQALPSDSMRAAKEDAESTKVPTDRSRESDAAYAKLRGHTPSSERDAGGS